MLSHHHLAELKIMKSPALAILERWRPIKRFETLDPAMATSDLVHNAVYAPSFPLLSPPLPQKGAMTGLGTVLVFCSQSAIIPKCWSKLLISERPSFEPPHWD